MLNTEHSQSKHIDLYTCIKNNHMCTIINYLHYEQDLLYICPMNKHVVMVALCNRETIYIFILFLLLLLSSFFFFLA